MQLEALIDEFVQAERQGTAAFWRKADAAVQIRAEFGSAGIRTLADNLHRDRRHLNRLIQMATVFPPGQRNLALTPTHHRRAMHALTRFPVGTAEHDPQHWLRVAQAQGWHSGDLRRAMQVALTPNPSLEEREDMAKVRFQMARRHREQAQAVVDRFNREDAVVWGTELVLVERALPFTSHLRTLPDDAA